MESWYCYTNGERGREARNGDLRLVVGCDKAKAWGMATFSRSSSTAQTSFRLDFKPLEQTGRSYKWEYSGIAEGRTGPSIRETTDLRLSGEPEDITFTNQCLFIRCLNHLLPNDVWERLEASKFGTIKSEDPAEYSSISNVGNSHISKGKAKSVASDPSSKHATTGTSAPNTNLQGSDLTTVMVRRYHSAYFLCQGT